MTDDITKNLSDSEKLDFLVNAVSDMNRRLGTVEQRQGSLEQLVQARLYDTRPLWEAVIQRLDNLQQQVDGLRQEVAELRQQGHDLRQEVAELRQQGNGLHQEFADLRQEFAELRQEFAELRRRIDNIELQLEAIRAHLQRHDDKLGKIIEQLGVLNDDVLDVRAGHRNLLKRMRVLEEAA